MILKPRRWNVSPALIAPEARSLWDDVAFVAPLWQNWGAKGWLLNSVGQPLAGANLTANGTQWRGTPYGLGLGNSNDAERRRLLQTGFAPIVTSDGAGTGDFTMVMLANPRAEARKVYALTQRSATPARQCRLTFNINGSDTAASGWFGLETYDGTFSVSAISDAVDGNWHMFGGVRSGSGHCAWVDGVLKTKNSLTVRNCYVSTADFCIDGLPHSSIAGMYAGDTIAMAAGWNRALSDAEMALLALDPFIMFRMAQLSPSLWTVASGADVRKEVIQTYMRAA